MAERECNWPHISISGASTGVRVDDLACGECFLYDNSVFMRITGGSVRLRNGEKTHIDEADLITPLQAEFEFTIAVEEGSE